MKNTPIAKPLIGKSESKAVENVLSSGWLTQGPKVAEFERSFFRYVGAKYACAVSNCTSALHIALLTVGVKPGDKVITVSHSFIATANSIRYCQAEPIFVDIETDTYNMSPQSLKACLLKQSKNRRARIAAILVVHQMGMPCDLNSILKISSEYSLPVIEDAACAIGSQIQINSKWEKIGKPHSDIACFSFHPRKVITTGEGGMLTTNNPKYDRNFRLLRQHGMSITDRVRHKAKKVIFEEYNITGYNYRMTDIQAAIGIEQLKKLPAIIKERRQIAAVYNQELSKIPWIKLSQEPSYCKTNWQSYPVMVKKDAPLDRNQLMQYLLERGISTRRGVMNAHQEKPFLTGNSLKNSELARGYVILLPIFPGLKKRKIERICKILKTV